MLRGQLIVALVLGLLLANECRLISEYVKERYIFDIYFVIINYLLSYFLVVS